MEWYCVNCRGVRETEGTVPPLCRCRYPAERMWKRTVLLKPMFRSLEWGDLVLWIVCVLIVAGWWALAWRVLTER